MKRFSAFASIAALFLFAASNTVFAQSGLDLKGKMKEGQYESTFKMDIPGLPAGLGSFTHKYCVTKEDIDKGKSEMFQDPKRGKGNSSCEMKNMKSSGNTISYDMECPKEGMNMSTTLTFGGDTVKGVNKMKMTGENAKDMPPGMANMQSTFECRFLGACSK